MKRIAIAVLLALAGCDDDEKTLNATDAGPSVDATVDASGSDAGPSVDAGADASDDRAAQVQKSLAAWNTLAAANPGPYWYEDENCVNNVAVGSAYLIEVANNVANPVYQRNFERFQCRAGVNRYTTLAGDGTMPNLYRLCSSLLERRQDTHLSFDEQGIVRECWVNDAPNCRDACGAGFYLLRRGFGKAPIPDGGVLPADGGTNDAGTDAGPV